MAQGFEATEFELPILIENTAGGDKAMTRELEIAAIGRLSAAPGRRTPGLCLDTCHA